MVSGNAGGVLPAAVPCFRCGMPCMRVRPFPSPPTHTHTHKKVFTTKKLQWCRGLISGVHGSSTLYPGVLFSTAASSAVPCLPAVFLSPAAHLLHPQVLVGQPDVFVKAGTAFFPGSSLTGNGLLVSDGPEWRRQRRLSNPAFRKAAVNK